MGLSLQTVTNNGAALTLERQSRSRSDSYGSQEHRASGTVHRVESLHALTSEARRVMLTLTVDEAEWARARAIVMRVGGSDIEVLKVVPVPKTSDLRVHIGLESHALHETMSRIMRSLKAAEFGPGRWRPPLRPKRGCP
jgi:hypothetical protein